jgi:hypothetical protein
MIIEAVRKTNLRHNAVLKMVNMRRFSVAVARLWNGLPQHLTVDEDTGSIMDSRFGYSTRPLGSSASTASVPGLRGAL